MHGRAHGGAKKEPGGEKAEKSWNSLLSKLPNAAKHKGKHYPFQTGDPPMLGKRYPCQTGKPYKTRRVNGAQRKESEAPIQGANCKQERAPNKIHHHVSASYGKESATKQKRMPFV